MADTEAVAQIKTELERLEEDCDHSGKSHFNANSRWTKIHYGLGIPAVVLSAVAGAVFLKDFPEAAGVIAVLGGILTAVSTFLKPSERAANHKSAGDQYLALKNDARVYRTITVKLACDDQTAVDGLAGFTKRRNELNQASASFSNGDFKLARAGIKAGESLHDVDKS